jgi:hypothetical protein
VEEHGEGVEAQCGGEGTVRRGEGTERRIFLKTRFVLQFILFILFILVVEMNFSRS